MFYHYLSKGGTVMEQTKNEIMKLLSQIHSLETLELIKRFIERIAK